jgi:hypothetical protein
MNSNSIDFNLITEWNYSQKEWDEFVLIEKANKKEDSIYFGICILILGTIALMILRGTSFLVGLIFTIPFAILIPWLRMKFSYKHLKKGIKKPFVRIYTDHLLINTHRIELSGKIKRVKSLKIIDAKNDVKLLEFDVQWITRKGPTNDEFRILIPADKITEAEKLITAF